LRAWLVLEDESGFSLVSPLRSSWAPRGQTPHMRTSLDHHQRLNLLGALLVSPGGKKVKLSMRSFQTNLRGEHVILFLQQILQRIAGPIVLVWDNHPIHQRRLVQDFIQSEPRLHVYSFPVCAPELNPVEFVWTLLSHATANFAPHTLSELCTKVHSAIAKIRTSKHRLSACLAGTKLSWT
jgi:transposase